MCRETVFRKKGQEYTGCCRPSFLDYTTTKVALLHYEALSAKETTSSTMEYFGLCRRVKNRVMSTIHAVESCKELSIDQCALSFHAVCADRNKFKIAPGNEPMQNPKYFGRGCYKATLNMFSLLFACVFQLEACFVVRSMHGILYAKHSSSIILLCWGCTVNSMSMGWWSLNLEALLTVKSNSFMHELRKSLQSGTDDALLERLGCSRVVR